MNEAEVFEDDEISLFDLWEKLREGWRCVIGGTVLGIAGALFTIFAISPKYEAVAIVQVGQVGQVGQVKVSGVPIEAPIQAVERMKTPSFQRRVAEATGDLLWLERISEANSGITSDLSLQVIKATVGTDQAPLIQLRATGLTREVAQRKAEAAVSQLTRVHAELAQPAVARMSADLAITREKLASAERDLDALGKLVATASIKDDRFTQLSLITTLRIQKEAETYNQRQMIMALETALEPPATQPARAIESIFVSEEPVSPKKALLLVLGSVGGLLVGIFWVFAINAFRRARQERVGADSLNGGKRYS